MALNSSWIMRSLGEVATLQRGFDLPYRNRVQGSIPIVTSSGIDDFHNVWKASGPGVITGRYGTIGQVFFVTSNYWPHNTTLYVKDFHGNAPKFIYYMLKTVDFATHSGKSGVPGVNRNDLHQEIVKIPPTLAEQEAIAGALSDADAWIESLEQLIAKKRQIKQGAMQELLTGKRRLPGFSGEWQKKPLLSLLSIASGQVNPKVEPFRSMCLIGPIHVESGTGKLIHCQTASEQHAISGKYIFEKGDVVYGKINPYLKKAFLAEFNGLCSADMYPLRPTQGVSSRFMLAVILGDAFSKYAESVSVRSGMPKINREEMSAFTVLLPDSLDEQTAIATILETMDTEIGNLEAKLTKARRIKQGMMQELLTGRIRLV